MRRLYSVVSLLLFLTGGLLYVLYRSLSLRMFLWIKALGLYPTVLLWRKTAKVCDMPGWVIYSLPDGLWMASYLLLMCVLWYRETSWAAFLFPMLLPLFMNVTEFLQGLGMFPGTFDAVDLICYDIPVFIFVLKYIYERKNSIACFCRDNRVLPFGGGRLSGRK